ncbi:Cuticle protein 16.8-like 1 [Homarus americanus]|uniref:Cuticle protein 16.8-like 1 n=1 Tax=Homarus americanus TaxID=6706 RepID=A0A8J5JGN8_HOMAM|nr:Cuticle protein 16.8-like 1 [Homarus americanus]
MVLRTTRWWVVMVMMCLASTSRATSPDKLTVADIQDSLLSPSSEQYAIYILPNTGDHVDSVQKRQAVYYDNQDDDRDEPQPEPEPGKTHHDDSVESVSRGARKVSEQPLPNIRYTPDAAYPPPVISAPFLLANFNPELQPGYGHEQELKDKIDSYAIVPEQDSSSQSPLDPTPRPTPTLSLQTSLVQSPITWDPTEEGHPQEEKPKSPKKLMNKPKKIMKVIKRSGEGQYLPEEVPGVMLPTEDGTEEAFVPADLLQDTEIFLTAASDQQPTFLPAAHQQFSGGPQAGGSRGMPYQFGWIVDDEATANFQTRQETGDEEGVVTGCYQVLDPNGLVRTVTYRADDGGFRVLSLTRGPDKTPCPGQYCSIGVLQGS